MMFETEMPAEAVLLYLSAQQWQNGRVFSQGLTRYAFRHGENSSDEVFDAGVEELVRRGQIRRLSGDELMLVELGVIPSISA